MRRIKRDTPAEEAAIQRGIATDPDAAEWTNEDFVQAHRATDVMPAEVLTGLVPRRHGPGIKPVKAHMIEGIECSQDNLSGLGWTALESSLLL